jgi:hypothetical protein
MIRESISRTIIDSRGPAIRFEYGTPEFSNAFLEAHAAKATPEKVPYEKTFQKVIDMYYQSRGKRRPGKQAGFLDLAGRTQADYRKQIDQVLAPRFGTLPLETMGDRRIRGMFLALRDQLAATSARQADYAMQVLSVLLSFAVERGKIDSHPLLGIGRVHDGTRADKIWTEEMEARFGSETRPDIAFGLTLAIGQRPGDILRLPWAKPDGTPVYDGTSLHIYQSKTGTWVTVPLLPQVRAVLDVMPRRGSTILTNLSGETWTYGGFTSVFDDEKKRLGISGASFGDARGTTVTRLRRASCSHAQIGAITGHSNAEINKIIEKHYAAADPVLAFQAIAKLAAYYDAVAAAASTSAPPAA